MNSATNWKIIYFISASGENPVRNFLESLQLRQKSKIFGIFENIQKYGLDSVIPHVKKLSGTPLWEIRVLGQDNIRVIYLVPKSNTVLVLHGFIKKTQQTSQRDLSLAQKRYKLWVDS
jgi:phage-related protein